MYTPISNIVVNAAMRWPSLGLLLATVAAFFSDSMVGQGIAWVTSVAFATYIATKTFGDHLCECDEKAIKQGLALIPAVSWVIEHNTESGSKRPWELFSMFGDDESTKQHYASYSTEEHAIARKEILEGKAKDKA